MEHTTVTLWGDFVENNGSFLEKLQDDKPILALCDVRVSIFKGIDSVFSLFNNYKLPIDIVSKRENALVILGRFGISIILVSSVLINPMFQKANDLRAWHEIIKADNKDLTITPTKIMKRAIEVPLAKILDGLFADSEDCMYKFKATIKDILNKDEPWYSACKKCHKKVKFIEDTAACNNCNSDNVEYEMRYCLRLEVCNGERRARVILFEAAKYILGCNVQDYIESNSVKCNLYRYGNLTTNISNSLHLIKKEECYYYSKLVLSKDKQFNFLVRIDMNDPNPRRSLIAEEIHQVEDEAPLIVENEAKSIRTYRKRVKKNTEGAAQIKQKKQKANRK
ncbi:hypothetical protein KY289_030080 [Solanum tuberosum]|nr:hypothetical protein KY289_030080 [Solanum tuberosum]